jgi:hypothetical protein
VTANEIRVRRVDIASLHTIQFVSHEGHEGRSSCTYETISVTSFMVGFIACLKKLTTTALKRSRRAGYRLKACCKRKLNLIIFTQQEHQVTYNFGEKLAKNANQLIVNQLTTFKGWFL